MKEFYSKMFGNIDSAVYTENRGAGFIPCKLGCYVGCDFVARSYSEMMDSAMGLIPEDVEDLIWDVVSETDELLMRMADGRENS